ncbi:MAG: hypothetical protein AB1704_35895, partial [Pseudomonadota bacterium]
VNWHFYSESRLAKARGDNACTEIDGWIVIPVVVGSSPISHPTVSFRSNSLSAVPRSSCFLAPLAGTGKRISELNSD